MEGGKAGGGGVLRSAWPGRSGAAAPTGRRGAFQCPQVLSALFLAWVALYGGAVAATDDGVTAERIEEALNRGVEWVKKQRDGDRHWEEHTNQGDRAWAGRTALAILAQLYAGIDARSEEIAPSLDWLAAQRLNGTYAYSLRAHVLAMVPGTKHRRRMADDLDWIVQAAHPRESPLAGGYGYQTSPESAGWADNSNSQFAVLGAWMATEAGTTREGMRDYWLVTEDYWTRLQNSDGGWGYRRDERSTGSMTAAGLTSLFVVLDRAHARTGHRKAVRLLQSIDVGLQWFGREFTPDNPYGARHWRNYYLYGVERCGRASGRKYFQQRDWFRSGAATLLRDQSEDGSWGGDLPETCFAILFLAHGRAPLMLNKLEHNGDWDVYLRDAAGLTRFCERTFERLLNWQVVAIDSPLADLLEAPVLYVSGQAAMRVDAAQTTKLREYCERGGLIFAVAAEGGGEFEKSIRELAERLFPGRPLIPVHSTHPLYTGEVQYRLEGPPLYHVSNGIRSLLILSPGDIAGAWNENRVEQRRGDYELGANIYLMATDKSLPRSRLDSPALALRPADIRTTLRIARVRYDGPWDVEPYGWSRLRDYLNNTAATRLLVTSGVSPAQLGGIDGRVAYISGTTPFKLSPEERSGLRAFLTGGGTLLADGAGGSAGFIESLEEEVRRALNLEPVSIPQDHPILTGEGITGAESLRGVQYRRAARVDRAREWPRLRGFDLGRRYAVVYSPLDLSAGLLGTPVYGCQGYAPESCLRIMRNLLLYANLSTAEKAALSGRP